MQNVRVTILILALSAVAGCVGTSEDEAGDVDEAVRSALVDLLTSRSLEWENAVEAANAEQLLALFVSDPDAAVVNPGASYRDYDSLTEALRTSYEALESQSLSAEDRRFAVLSPTAVAETLRGTIESTALSDEVRQSTFAVTRVWVLRNGQWLILHQNFAAMPLSEPSGS